MARGAHKGFYRSIEEQAQSLDAAVVRHIAQIEGPEIANALVKDGQALASKMSAKAPESRPGRESGQARKFRGAKPGYERLKKAPVAKLFKNQTPGKQAVFVALDRKVAYQGHLVEFGHKLVKRMKMTVKAGFTSASLKTKRVIGKVAAKPFFRPAFRAFKSLPNTEAALKRIIERTGK